MQNSLGVMLLRLTCPTANHSPLNESFARKSVQKSGLPCSLLNNRCCNWHFNFFLMVTIILQSSMKLIINFIMLVVNELLNTKTVKVRVSLYMFIVQIKKDRTIRPTYLNRMPNLILVNFEHSNLLSTKTFCFLVSATFKVKDIYTEKICRSKSLLLSC